MTIVPQNDGAKEVMQVNNYITKNSLKIEGIFITFEEFLSSSDERRTCPLSLSWEVSSFQYRMGDTENMFPHGSHLPW